MMYVWRAHVKVSSQSTASQLAENIIGLLSQYDQSTYYQSYVRICADVAPFTLTSTGYFVVAASAAFNNDSTFDIKTAISSLLETYPSIEYTAYFYKHICYKDENNATICAEEHY